MKSLNVTRDKRMMKEQLKDIQIRIDNLLLMQGQASGSDSLKLVMRTFESLSKEKSTLEERLARMNSGADQEELIKESVQVIQDILREFERGYKKAKGSMKKSGLTPKKLTLSYADLINFCSYSIGV